MGQSYELDLKKIELQHKLDTHKIEMEHEREMARIRLEERKLNFQEEKLHAEREVYGQDGRGDGQNKGESMPDINDMHFD